MLPEKELGQGIDVKRFNFRSKYPASTIYNVRPSDVPLTEGQMLVCLNFSSYYAKHLRAFMSKKLHIESDQFDIKYAVENGREVVFTGCIDLPSEENTTAKDMMNQGNRIYSLFLNHGLQTNTVPTEIEIALIK